MRPSRTTVAIGHDRLAVLLFFALCRLANQSSATVLNVLALAATA
jgi:hypothetical protein